MHEMNLKIDKKSMFLVHDEKTNLAKFECDGIHLVDTEGASYSIQNLDEMKRNLLYFQKYGQFIQKGITDHDAMELLEKGAPLLCVGPDDWYDCVIILKNGRYMYMHEYAHYFEDSELTSREIKDMVFNCFLPAEDLLWAMNYKHEYEDEDDE